MFPRKDQSVLCVNHSWNALEQGLLPPSRIDCRWGVAFECLDSLRLPCIWTPLPTFRESLMNPPRSYNDTNKGTEGVFLCLTNFSSKYACCNHFQLFFSLERNDCGLLCSLMHLLQHCHYHQKRIKWKESKSYR